MVKIGRAIQDAGHFRETHLVGVGEPEDASVEDLGNGLHIVRLKVPRFGLGHLGRIRRAASWYVKVLARYHKLPVAMVAAHSVWVLPLSWALARRTKAVLIYRRTGKLSFCWATALQSEGIAGHEFHFGSERRSLGSGARLLHRGQRTFCARPNWQVAVRRIGYIATRKAQLPTGAAVSRLWLFLHPNSGKPRASLFHRPGITLPL